MGNQTAPIKGELKIMAMNIVCVQGQLVIGMSEGPTKNGMHITVLVDTSVWDEKVSLADC